MTKLNAYNLLRPEPHYRRDAASAGLTACGYAVSNKAPDVFAAGDVLLIWNRYSTNHALAEKATAAGAHVIVMENPYFGAPGEHYALALDHHNGAGRWFVGAGIQAPFSLDMLTPWRPAGEHVLVLAQRGIGEPGLASPRDFERSAVDFLRSATTRTVVVRKHPGNMTEAEKAAQPPLAEQFKNCWAAVTWSSAAGLRAILAGIPTFYIAPTITWKDGASGGGWTGLHAINAPRLPDRAAMLRKTSWAQWSLADIENGRAFASLLAVNP